MAEFKQIDEARKLLGLGETATLKEIKGAYRKMVFRYHPDKCRDEKKKECEEMFKKIGQANDILMAYCAGCKHSFRKEDVIRADCDYTYAEHMRRFYEGWIV